MLPGNSQTNRSGYEEDCSCTLASKNSKKFKSGSNKKLRKFNQKLKPFSKKKRPTSQLLANIDLPFLLTPFLRHNSASQHCTATGSPTRERENVNTCVIIRSRSYLESDSLRLSTASLIQDMDASKGTMHCILPPGKPKSFNAVANECFSSAETESLDEIKTQTSHTSCQTPKERSFHAMSNLNFEIGATTENKVEEEKVSNQPGKGPFMLSVHDRKIAFTQNVEEQLPTGKFMQRKAEQERIDKVKFDELVF